MAFSAVLAFMSFLACERLWAFPTLVKAKSALRFLYLGVGDGRCAPTLQPLVSALIASAKRRHKVKRALPIPVWVFRAVFLSASPLAPLDVLITAAIFALGLASAARPCDLILVRLTHLSFVDGGLRVTFPRSKNRRTPFWKHIVVSHSDPLCPGAILLRLVAQLPVSFSRSSFLFPQNVSSPGVGLSLKSISKRVKDECLRHGFKWLPSSGFLGASSLRKGAAAVLESNGASLAEGQSFLEHAGPSHLDAYFSPGFVQPAFNKKKAARHQSLLSLQG
jgi:integrase